MRTSILIVVFFSLNLSSCGDRVRDREDYGNLQEGIEGVTIANSQEHRGGYGRQDCLVCHNVALNVHRGTGSPIDPIELNRLYKSNGEQAYCMTCHGTNGTR